MDGVVAAYRGEVMQRYAALAARFGTDRVAVRFGERLHPATLARQLLATIEAAEPFFAQKVRRLIEATTGVDGSRLFVDGRFHPETARAWLTEFLASDVPARFQPGVRYFFGHRIGP